MSPRHNFDPSAISSTLEVLPKGDYVVSAGEGKAFEKTAKSGPKEGQLSWGIRWPLRVEQVLEGDPNAKGKRVIYSGYMHSDDASGFPKQLLMACLGYEINNRSEREFNEKFAGQDWSYDTDSGAIGDVWRQATGRTVIVSLDVQPNINTPGEFIQQFTRFRPVSQLAAAVR